MRTPTSFLWFDIGVRSAQMMAASAQVIGHRTAQMMAAGARPSRSDRLEFERMGTEKARAAIESSAAMAPYAMQSWGRLALLQWRCASAAVALGASRTPRQAASRYAELARVMSDWAAEGSHQQTRGAQMIARGLAPLHAKSTANARRLARKRRRR